MEHEYVPAATRVTVGAADLNTCTWPLPREGLGVVRLLM